MADLKVVEFKKKDDDYVPSMPSEEILSNMLEEEKLRACIVITMNESGAISHYIDHLNNFEAIGVLESVKAYILS